MRNYCCFRRCISTGIFTRAACFQQLVPMVHAKTARRSTGGRLLKMRLQYLDIRVLLVPVSPDMVEDEAEGAAFAGLDGVAAYRSRVNVRLTGTDEAEAGALDLRLRATRGFASVVKPGLHSHAIDGPVAMIGDDAIDIGELTAGHVGALAQGDVADGELAGVGIGGGHSGLTGPAAGYNPEEHSYEHDTAGNHPWCKGSSFLLRALPQKKFAVVAHAVLPVRIHLIHGRIVSLSGPLPRELDSSEFIGQIGLP